MTPLFNEEFNIYSTRGVNSVIKGIICFFKDTLSSMLTDKLDIKGCMGCNTELMTNEKENRCWSLIKVNRP